MNHKSFLTMQEAANLYALHRSTIYAKVKEGLLTASLDENNKKVVQIQDLIRVFGEPSKEMPKIASVVRQSVARHDDDDIHRQLLKQMEERIFSLENDKKMLHEQIHEMREDYRKNIALLEYKYIPKNSDTDQHSPIKNNQEESRHVDDKDLTTTQDNKERQCNDSENTQQNNIVEINKKSGGFWANFWK